ncbi:hypothetical protein [Aphanothece sacrum]|uniref:Maltooligosyl trehalose synthase n=1 Tax=Aphanothece sacrum FPU1 TaxID=1920663 RepID=A0A401ID93_APHSA|nr:hypothetical protein [Aphanothece sacrum]GBF79245.1 maltooligosyl trehalose synthase [Aphanothece sacrum FPU1]GBF86746.1 maltooligosyl trehalose synthase [Aphanothece sacrum FPU3]
MTWFVLTDPFSKIVRSEIFKPQNIDPKNIDPQRAFLALKVLFIFTCATTWVGLSNSVTSIIHEKSIYIRERLVNLKIIPYLGSKL